MDSQVFYQVPEEDEPRVAIVNPIQPEPTAKKSAIATTKNYGSINFELPSKPGGPQKKNPGFEYVFIDESNQNILTTTLQQIFNDPSTFMLASFIISIPAILSVYLRDYSQTFILINIASMFYTIFMVIWKNFICDSKNMKVRKLYDLDTDETMSFIFVMNHLSCVMFIDNCKTPFLLLLLSLTNSAIFGFIWYSNQKTRNFQENKELTPEYQNQEETKDYFLKCFKQHSLTFNFVRFILFICAFLACKTIIAYSRIYFVYCTLTCVFGTLVLLIEGISKKTSNFFYSYFILQPKAHTYLSLFVAFHAFLIVLSNAFGTGHSRESFYDENPLSYVISIPAISTFNVEEYSNTFIAINIASLIFVIFSIFALAFWKDHENFIGESKAMINFVGGHKICWNEVDETMSFIFGISHLSCIIFMKTCRTSPLLFMFFSLTNAAIFGINWFKNLKPTRLHSQEERTPEFQQMATKNFYKGLKDFSLILNFIRFAFFIAAFYACVILDVEPIIYFVYCTGACVGGTMVLIGMEISEKIDSRFVSTFFPSNHYSFVSLFVTIHAFLIVLSNSLLHEFNGRRWGSFSDECPLSYAISCLVFVFSLMDLYSQTIFSRTQAQSVITTVEALSIETATKKNLPMTIENPFIVENEKKQIVY